jgi:hypothetical protein
MAMNGDDQAQRGSAVYGIYDTLLTLFEMAAIEGVPTSLAADHLAEQRLRIGREAVYRERAPLRT